MVCPSGHTISNLSDMILTTLISILPCLSPGIIDTTNVETLGLTMAQGTKTITIFSPTDETHHYANGVVMTAFKGTLYCMWQSSHTDEDAPETCVMFCRSTDEGMSWTKPALLAAPTDSSYCTSGGWISTDDTLTAFINVWPKGLQLCPQLSGPEGFRGQPHNKAPTPGGVGV